MPSPYDGLYWETSVPLGLHKVLQDLTKQNTKDPNVPDIWTPSTDREWYSLPRSAGSYSVKHNVFTFGDAGKFFSAGGERTTVGSDNLTPDHGDDFDYGQSGYGAQVARNLDPNIFNWFPIAYNSYAFPMNVSIAAAVDKSVNIILGTPGKIFLIGTGVGAAVASKLYNEFRSGRLVSRREDLLGVYNYGNPLRETGRGIPGPIGNRRIKILECAGTGGFPQVTGVSRNADPNYFEHKLITNYPNVIFPLQNSVSAGIDAVMSEINSTTGRFVLVGTSQGAQIMGTVYQMIRGTDREDDCVGVFLMGNPIREEGRAFPGASPIPPGQGIAPAAYRMTNTPDLVWEFANPGDPVCTNGIGEVFTNIEGIYRALMEDFSGLIPDLGGELLAVWQMFTGMAGFHNEYEKDSYKPIAGDPRSGMQIIADQLNKVIGPAHIADYQGSTALPMPGHGMADPSERLSGTEDLVWEFADPADIIATQYDDDKGEWAAAIYNALNQDITGPDSLLSEIVELVLNPFGELPALVFTLKDIIQQLFSNGGAHNDYQNFYPIRGSRLNSIELASANIKQVGADNPPEVISEPITEVLTTNYRQPVSISEISFEVLRNSVFVELWYQDRTNRWKQLTDESSSPITLSLASTDAVSWYKYHANTYPVVAKAIQFRATRRPDPLIGDTPYCVGIRNTLVRRNVYDRSAGIQNLEDEQDALGNVITKVVKDWDASKAIDDNATTFWKSAPQPDPNAVVSFYLDTRDAYGDGQMVDKIYLDPVYTGQTLNLYYANDEMSPNLRLNPVALTPNPDTESYAEWRSGIGLVDATTNDSQLSLYECQFNVGPMVKQDCWIGIQWTPAFKPYEKKVTSYIFDPVMGSVTLQGIGPVEFNKIHSIYNVTTSTLMYSKNLDQGDASFNTETYELRIPLDNIDAKSSSTDSLLIYYGIDGPAPTQLVLFELVPINVNGIQAWVRIYYDAGSASLNLEMMDSRNSYLAKYTAPLNLLFDSGMPMNIVVGWTYSTETPTIFIKACNDRQITIAEHNTNDGSFPKNLNFEGKIRYQNWRGTFNAHVFKQESYAANYQSFLSNPTVYCNPEPILLHTTKNKAPSSSLDNALMAADWTVQRFAAGGVHSSNYTDKEWIPIWSNYITEKGFLYLPRTTRMKYLKLEFTQLTAEPYPIYDQGIKTTYQVFPITVTQTQAVKQPDGLLGTLGNIFSAITSINWLNPASISQAINSIFGRTVQPVQTTLQIGPGYTTDALPNTTQSAITESVRTEANSPAIYRRTPVDPYSIVKNFLGSLMGQTQGQTQTLIPTVQQEAIQDQTNLTQPTSASTAALPIQGQDWYVFPGQTLRMPASVINGLTNSQVVTDRNNDKSTRLRFTTTAVHRYEVKTVTLDAAIAYFAGIREIQPYVVKYIDYEDDNIIPGSSAQHPEFKFDSYDNTTNWSFVNVNQLATGPITAKSNPYVIKNSGFDLDISHWNANGNWDWDNSEGHKLSDNWQPGIPLIYGAAHTVADSTNQSLLSESVPVTALDEINFSAWVVFKDAESTDNGKIYVDAVGLSGTSIVDSGIYLGPNMQIINPLRSSVPVFGMKAVHLYGSCQVPYGVNNIRLRLNVNAGVTAGDVWFDDVDMTPSAGVIGSAYNIIDTNNTYSRVRCKFKDTGLKRSDSMWALANANYAATLPPAVLNITQATGDGNTATITVDQPPDFSAGEKVKISGLTPTGYNGTWTVTAVSANEPYTFTYDCKETGFQAPASGSVAGIALRVADVRSAADTNVSSKALAYYTSTIPPTKGISTIAASGTGSVATLVLDSKPNFVVGEPITVSGVNPTEYNGIYNVSAVSTTVPYTVSYPSTATGNQTLPGVVASSTFPNGTWGDTFGTWSDKIISWGTPFAEVAIQIDPNMVYDKKRVIHFYRSASSGGSVGEAGIVVRQETNFVPDALFRICAKWYKKTKNNNTIKMRLRRVSGDDGGGLYPNGYVYQETVSPVPTGYWHTHQTRWAKIPQGQDQVYTVEFTLDGDAQDDIYLSDLWVEISHIRYHVKLGGGIDHDVTALAYTDNCTVGATDPVTQMELSTTIYGDTSFAYSSSFTPLYLK